MNTQVKTKIDQSKERLARWREDLVEKGEEVRTRSEDLRAQLERDSSRAVGRLRDASLTQFFDAGASTLTTAAELLEKVPFAHKEADQLRERAEAVREAREAVQRPPIDDYDELNVDQVRQALDGLSAYELEKVRRYEAANKDRVTVLREVERRLG